MSKHPIHTDFHKVQLVKIGLSSRTGLNYPRDVLVGALDRYFAKAPLHGEVSSPRYEDHHGASYERRVMHILPERTSHVLLNQYEIEDDVVYGYAKESGMQEKAFKTLAERGALNFAMRSLIRTAGDVVTVLEILSFDLTPDDLVKSKENIHVSRNGGRKVYAYRYMGFIGAVPEFMRNDLTKQFAELDELDWHQEKIEFYPEKYVEPEIHDGIVGTDTRPMLVCNTGDWIVRRDRYGWYDTAIFTHDDFIATFHEVPLKG